MADNNGKDPGDVLRQMEMYHSMNNNYENSSDPNYNELRNEYQQAINKQNRWHYDPTAINPNVDAKDTADYEEYDRLGVNFTRGSKYNQTNLWQNQSVWEKSANAAYRFGWNTLYDTIGGVAAMLDFEDYYNQDDEVGNFVTEWAAKKKQETNEAAPIYKPEDASIGNFAWWLDNGSALASSVAAFGLQGMGVGMAFKGIGAARMLGRLGQTGRLGKAAMRGTDDIVSATGQIDDIAATGWDKFMTAGRYKNLEAAAKGLDNFGATLMLNQAESIMTASELYQETYQNAVARGYNPDYAKKVAAQAATHSINLNRANMLLNLTSTDMFLKGMNNMGAIKDKITTKSVLKKALGEGLQETGEELVNLFAEKQGSMYGEQLLNEADARNQGKPWTGKPVESGYRSLIDSYSSIDMSNPFGDATFKEGFETALLGFLGGLGQTGLTSTMVQGKGAALIDRGLSAIGGDKISTFLGLMNTQDATYKENQYYADGSIKHRKGDKIVETQDATYKEDQLDDDGKVIHKKGEVIYKTALDPVTGETIKEAVQENKLDSSGKPIVLKLGQVDEQGNKIEGGKARKFTYNDLYNFRIDEQNEEINKFKDQANKMERLIGGAKIQSQIERTIFGIDSLVSQMNTISEEDKQAIHEDLASLELLQEGDTQITPEKVKEKAKEYQGLNEKQLRKKQDELLEMSLASKALESFELGTEKILEDMFKEVMKMTPEQAKEKGYGDNYKSNAEKSLGKIKEYKKLYQEYNAKHDPRTARYLFLNRIKRENLGTEAQILNKEIQDLHDKEYERFAAEQGLDKEKLETREKYDKAYQLEKQRAEKLARSSELKKLNEEKEQIRKEMKKLSQEASKLTDKKQLDAAKVKLKELSDKFDDNSKKIKEAEDAINKPIDEEIKNLKLGKEAKGVQNQAALHAKRVEILNKAIALDKEFDRLRSKEGEEEIKRQAIEKYRKGVKNELFKQYMSKFLETQREGGTILYFLDKDNPVEGRIEFKNGKYTFVTKEERFAIPEDRIDDYNVTDPSRQEEIDKIKEKIKKNNEAIAKLDAKLKRNLKNHEDLIKNVENATSIDEILVPNEKYPKKDQRKKYRESLLKRKDGSFPPLSEAKKIIIEDAKRRFQKNHYVERTNAAGVTETVNKDALKLIEANERLQKEIDTKFNFYKIEEGQELTEDEKIKFVTTPAIEIPLSFDELLNIVEIEGTKNKAYIADRDLKRSLYDRIARIERVYNESRSAYADTLTAYDEGFKLNTEYAEQIALYNKLLLALNRGDITDKEFDNIPEVAQLKMMQLKMQDILKTALTDKLNEAKSKIINVEKETEVIKQNIEVANNFLLDQKNRFKKATEDLKKLKQEIKDKKKQFKTDKSFTEEGKKFILASYEAKLKHLQDVIISARKLQDSAKADIKTLNKNIKELEKVANGKVVQDAIAEVEKIKQLLTQVGDKGFNGQIFKLISDIRSFSNKKKELETMLKVRELQKKALMKMMNTYTAKINENKDIIASLKETEQNRFDEILNMIDTKIGEQGMTDKEVAELILLRDAISYSLNNTSDTEPFINDQSVDEKIRDLFMSNIISKKEFNKLITKWTEYKSSYDMLRIHDRYVSLKMSYPFEYITDSDETKLLENEGVINEDAETVPNMYVLLEFFESANKTVEDYNSIREELEEVEVELDRMKSIGNSAYIMIDEKLANELFSLSENLLNQMQESMSEQDREFARFVGTENIMNFDFLVKKIQESASAAAETRNKIAQNQKENVDNLRKLESKLKQLDEEYGKLFELRDKSIDDYENLTDSFLVEDENYDEDAIIEAYEKFETREKMLMIADEMAKEIDILKKEIENLKETIALTEEILDTKIKESEILGSSETSDVYYDVTEEIEEAHDKLSSLTNKINEINKKKRELELSIITINDIYNREKAILNDPHYADKLKRIEARKINEEFKKLLKSLREKAGGDYELLTWFDLSLVGNPDPKMEGYSFQKTDPDTGKVTTYRFRGVGSSSGQRTMIFDVYEDGVLLHEANQIKIKYNDDKNKPNLPTDAFNFLKDTEFVGIKPIIKDEKRADKKYEPEQTLSEDLTERTGNDEAEYTDEGKEQDNAKSNLDSDRQLDARRSTFASPGKHIWFDLDKKKRIHEKGLPVITKNVHDIRWFNKLNEISQEEDYQSNYQIKIVSTYDPLIKDLPLYTDKGQVSPAKTFGEWTDKSGNRKESVVMILVDNDGNPVIGEDGGIVFQNLPENKTTLTKNQLYSALREINESRKGTGQKPFNLKSTSSEAEAAAKAHINEKLKAFKAKALEMIKSGEEVVLPINYISAGHEYTQETEPADNQNFLNLLNELKNQGLSNKDIDLIFGGNVETIPEKVTKPNQLYLRFKNSHITLQGRKINNNEVAILAFLFGKWANAPQDSDSKISMIDGSGVELESQESIFKLINDIIYYDRAKGDKFENYQMLLRNDVLKFKPNTKDLVVHQITKKDLMNLVNPDGTLKLPSELNSDQKKFLEFLSSMRRQVFKKKLQEVKEQNIPVGISEGKLVVATYPSYKEYLLSSQSPLSTRTVIPAGTNDPIISRYLSFDPSPVIGEVKDLDSGEILDEETGEEEKEEIDETDEDYTLETEEEKEENVTPKDEKVGRSRVVQISSRMWNTNSLYKNNNKYSATYVIYGKVDGSDKWSYDSDKNLIEVNYYENGKLITDSNKVKEIEEYFKEDVDAFKNLFNIKTSPTLTPRLDQDRAQVNINALNEANDKEAADLLTEIKDWTKPVESTFKPLKKKVTSISFNGALKRMNKTPVFSKFLPLIKSLKFGGRLVMDEGSTYPSYNKETNTINMPRQVENMTDVDALNIIHELTHAGTQEWLENPANRSTEEYKRLQELRNVLLNKVLDEIIKPDSYFLKEMGEGFNAMTYILFGGNNFKLTKEQVVNLVTKFRNKEITGEDLIKELSKGMSNEASGLVELVTFAMSNKEFQEKLNSMKLTEEDKKILQTKSKNIWDYLLDMIKSIFGVEVKDGYLLKEVLEATADVTQNLDRKLSKERKEEEREIKKDEDIIENNRNISLNNIVTDYDSKNDLYISVGFVIDKDGNKIEKRQLQEMSLDKDKHEGLKELINNYYDKLKEDLKPKDEESDTTPTEPTENEDVEKEIYQKVSSVSDELGFSGSQFARLNRKIKLLVADKKYEEANSILSNKDKLKKEYVEEDLESPITTLSSDSFNSISRSKEYDKIINSFNNIFNNFETLSHKERISNIKTLTTNILTYDKIFKLFDKLDSKYKDKLEKIMTTMKVSKADAYYELLLNLFEDYLNGDNKNINKDVLSLFDDIAEFYNDNIVTNKLQNHHNTYNQLSNQKDDSLVYSPIMDTKITVEGVELTQEESTAIMDGMTSMMFKYFKNQDVEQLFSENVDWFDVYKNIRKDLNEELKKLHKAYKESLDEAVDYVINKFGKNSPQYNKFEKEQDAEIEKLDKIASIRKALFLESQGDTEWKKAWERHALRMRSYGISYDFDELIGMDETETVRDREFNKSQGEDDEKSKIPPAVKLWIASRSRSTSERNILNFPVLFDFNDSYNYIVNKLAGLPASSIVMKEKLESLRSELLGKGKVEDLSDYKRYRYELLNSMLEDDGVFTKGRSLDATEHEFKLLNQIVQTFSKQKPRFFIGRNLDNGDISFMDSNQNKSSDLTIREWKDNFNSKLVDTTVGKAMPKKVLMNAATVIEKFSKILPVNRTEAVWNELSNALESIGINISNIKEFNDKFFVITGKGFPQVLKESIKNASIDEILKVNEKNESILNYNLIDDKNIQGTIKLIAEIETDINQIAVNNQFIAADNQTNYGITLNHYLSLNVNEINYIINKHKNKKLEDPEAEAARRKELMEKMPHLFHVFNSNSKLLDDILLFGYNIELSIFNGFVPQSGDGKVVKDLGEANRWAMLMSSTMAKHPIYTFFRAADRTTEAGFRILDKNGVPVDYFRGSGDNKVNSSQDIINKRMYDYLRDEIKALIYFEKVGLGKNIMHYEKNAVTVDKDKKKTLNFKYFSDDKLVYNKYQKDEKDYRKILSDAILKAKLEKGKDDTETAVDKLVEKIIQEVDRNNELKKAFRQYFERQALGYYMDNGKKIIPEKISQQNKDLQNSVKRKIEELGLLSRVDQLEEEVYDEKEKKIIVKKLPRNGRFYAGISSDILRQYLPENNANPSDEAYDIALNRFLVDFEANQFASYVEFGKLLVADPTMFKNQDDYFKRMSMFNSTKKPLIDDPEFNSMLNNRTGGKLYIKHDGRQVSLDISVTREDIAKGLDFVRSKYSKQIEAKIKAVSFLNDNNYTVNDVQIHLDLGYKKYFEPNKDQWKSRFKSVIFNDIGMTSNLAKEDGVNKIEYKNGVISYFDKDGTAITDVSDLTKLFTESFVKDGITDSLALTNKVKSYLKPFKGYDESDGQSYVTLDGYKEILMRSGDWTIEQGKAYSKVRMGLPLDTDEIALFPILKTQYTGPLSNTPGLNVPAGYKHSVFPLIPEVVKGTKLDKLREFMEENDITLANMLSANKYGTIYNSDGKIADIYNEEGNFNYDRDNKTVNGTKVVTQETEWKWLGVQVDQGLKFKKKITVGSQFRKLVLSNIMSQGVPVDYAGTKSDWKKLTEEQKKQASDLYRLQQEYIDIQSELVERPFDELAELLGLEAIVDEDDNITGYDIKNRDALIDIIIESQIERNLPDNVIVSLNSLKDPDVFVEQVLNKEKVEQIIHALINSRVVREKRKGEMSPQVASSLFEFDRQDGGILVTEGKRLMKLDGKPVKELPAALKTYRQGKNGKTLPAEAMISIPQDLIQWVNETQGGLDGFNAKLDKLHEKLYAIEERGEDLKLDEPEQNLLKLITVIGFRIPNQGLNSSDYMRIRRFLPITFGYSVVVPSEMIPKAGSDFDIDKLSMYMPGYSKPKKKGDKWTGPEYIKYYTKDNSTLEERYNAFVDNHKSSELDEEVSELRDQLKKENAKLFSDIDSQFDLYENASEESFESYKNTLKSKANEVYDKKTKKEKLSALYSTSKLIFKQLPVSVKENYWNTEESLNIQNPIDKLNYYKSFTESYIKTLSNFDNDVVIEDEKSGRQYYIKNVISILNDLNKSYDDIFDLSNDVQAKKEYEDFKDYLKNELKLIQESNNKEKFIVFNNIKQRIQENNNAIKNAFRMFKIKKYNLPSMSEFDKLPLEKQNSNDALQNRMIEIHTELISHPMNYRQLMSPISDAILNDQDNGIVWDIRFLQDTDEIVIEDADGKKRTIIPSLELLKIRDKISKSLIYNEDGSIKYDNIKGYTNVNGTLNTNKADISKPNFKINNVVFNDDVALVLMGEIAKEYNTIRKQWYAVKSKEFKQGTFAQVASSVTNMKKFIEFLSGKTGGVGQTAVHITHHQLAAAVDLSLNNKNPYWIFPHNKNEEGYPSFANTLASDGELISETLSAFLNSYVDVAKDPYVFSINAGSQTANMIFMMIRAGAPIKWIGRFLSQPIIKNYVKEQSANESIPIKMSGLEITKADIFAGLTETAAKYSIYKNNEDYDNEYEENFNKLKVENRTEEMPAYDFTSKNNVEVKVAWERYKKLQDAGLFSYDKLGDYILYQKYEDNTGEVPAELNHIGAYYKDVQAALLDLFLEYQRQSKHFQELIRASSADTKGIPQNRFALEADLLTTKKVLSSKMWNNGEKLIDKTIVKQFNEARKKTHNMYSSLYLVEKQPLLKKTSLELFDIFSPIMSNAKARIKLHDTIVNDMIMALISVGYNNTSVTKQVYEELVTSKRSNKSKYKDMNGDPISLPEFINLLKDKKTDYKKTSNDNKLRKLWPLRKNKFIQKITGYISNNPLDYDGFVNKTQVTIGNPSVNYIRYINSKGIQEEVNTDTESLQEIKEKDLDFYNDIVRFAIFQSGFNTSPNSFVDKIPAADVNRIKREAVESFLSLDPEQQENIMNQFKEQFKRRNLQFNPGVKRFTKISDKTIEDGKTIRKKSRYVKIDENVSVESEDGSTTEVSMSRIDQFGFLTTVRMDETTGKYNRVGLSGNPVTFSNGSNYLFFGKSSPMVSIVGEEMYFTGYDLVVNSVDESKKNNELFRNISNFRLNKRLEKLTTEKAEVERVEEESVQPTTNEIRNATVDDEMLPDNWESPFTSGPVRNKVINKAQDIASKWIEDSNCKR